MDDPDFIPQTGQISVLMEGHIQVSNEEKLRVYTDIR